MSRAKILVVDDHAGVAKALVTLARVLGYEATDVHGGQQALDHARAARPDLMLLDLQMPGLSGFDVLRALRADARFDSMPIVACSAAPAEQVRDEAMRLGAQDFIPKEDAFEELGPILGRQLRQAEKVSPASH